MLRFFGSVRRMMTSTVSVRMLWPFMRALHEFGPQMSALRAAGVDEATLADPDARIPRRLAGEIVWTSIQITGDVALGVHAGECAESADFGVMDHAVRACPDIRQALRCIARYSRLQDDNVEPRLIEDGDRAVIEIRNATPIVLRATNDFQVTVAVMNMARRLGRPEAPLEVHLRHQTPTNASEYARVFRAPVRLGMPHNGIVIERRLLDMPVPSANPDAFSAFDLRSDRLLRALDRVDSASVRVQRLLMNRIGQDAIGIDEVAAELHMSAATLRRRLDDEGTTFRALVDELRRELALRYVSEPRVAIGEIAFLLGFSTQSSFGTAFRRWTGASPLEHRTRLRAAKQLS